MDTNGDLVTRGDEVVERWRELEAFRRQQAMQGKEDCLPCIETNQMLMRLNESYARDVERANERTQRSATWLRQRALDGNLMRINGMKS